MMVIEEADRTLREMVYGVVQSTDLVARGWNTNTLQDRDIRRMIEDVAAFNRAQHTGARQSYLERDMANEIRTLRSQL
jgi:hypothetical protein